MRKARRARDGRAVLQAPTPLAGANRPHPQKAHAQLCAALQRPEVVEELFDRRQHPRRAHLKVPNHLHRWQQEGGVCCQCLYGVANVAVVRTATTKDKAQPTALSRQDSP